MKYTYLLVLSLLMVATACRKTEKFYEQLENLPRANQLSNTSYAVGDTLSLTGKFGAGKADLKIMIGEVNAPVISIVTRDSSYTQNEVLHNYTLDEVKVLITTSMIGQQQPVNVSVNGISSTVAFILVSKDKPVPARTDTLNYLDATQAEVAIRMPAGTRVVSNYAPGGAIVLVNGDSLVTWQEGVIRRGKVAWKDSYGDFSLLDPANIDYGFASDPAGLNLYISCLTTDAQLPGATHSAARLIKVSLRDYSVTVLNRTVLPTSTGIITDSDLDLDTVKREGNINQVFLPVMQKIYVNSKGELFFSGPSLNWYVADGLVYSNVPSNLTVSYLNASDSFQYLAKGAVYDDKIFQVYIIKNETLNFNYDFIPSVTTVFNYTRLLGIDAENDLLYGYTGSELGSTYIISTFYCYNLAQKRQVSEFTYKRVDRPTVTDGPFNVVDGSYMEFTFSTRIFQWPSPGQPMVIFAQQQQAQQVLPGADEFRSVKMINFSDRSVSTYAPFIQGSASDSKYRFGIGGDVVGYTASKQPVMMRNNTIDNSLNEVLLITPLQ